MTSSPRNPHAPRASDRLASLTLLVGLGLALRALAALVVQAVVERKGTRCVFPDTEIYWQLAAAIRAGTTYVVDQFGQPHHALRTPGYPLFLAAVQSAFGDGRGGLVAARLVQAILGAGCVWLVDRLVRRVHPEGLAGRGWTSAHIAAALAAVEPYAVGMSVLLLSEALFIPLMLLGLWGLARLWPSGDEAGPKRPGLLGFATGLAWGAATLARPSWLLFVPLVLLAWVAFAGMGRRGRAARGALVVALGLAVAMAPWWARNARVVGRFVPTALWVGASLYDGLNPAADGSSDMTFLESKSVRDLDEVTQDATLRSQAIRFARQNPRRVFELAAIKLGRFWSPWPNAEGLRSRALTWGSAAATLPVFALVLVGAWDRRRDARALVLLAGPLAYFMVLHAVFVSSVRYRVPGMFPAFGLAAFGARRLFHRGEGGAPGRLRTRARRALAWATLLTLSTLVGAVGFAYVYVTDSDTLAAFLAREVPRYLPTASLRVDRVRLRPLVGDVTLTGVQLWQRLDGRSVPLLRVPWVRVDHDLGALLHGKLVPREVLLAQPELRVSRRKDGTFNLQGLLASPWPDPPLPEAPTVTIQNGTVQLVDDRGAPATLLREVAIRVEPTAGGLLRFEGTARGDDLFERLRLEGTVDPKTGRIRLTKGDLSRLALSTALRDRLPRELRPALEAIGLTAGALDVAGARVEYDPAGSPRVRYKTALRLRSGTWNCPKLPFPLFDAELDATAEDGRLVVEHAEAANGKTRVRAEGTLALDAEAAGPFDLSIRAEDLELDDRLRARTPPQFADLWAEYRPRGVVGVALRVVRATAGGPVGVGMTAAFRDVSLVYRNFKYPLDHVSGTLRYGRGRFEVDLATLIGNEPARAYGTIDDPGPDAVVQLTFEAAALPVDRTLLDALPPDARAVVDQFRPTGAVRGTAYLSRSPGGPGDPPEGDVQIHALLDLVPEGRCAIVWEGMPYAVEGLTGRLELHPDHWIFQNMNGHNGLANIHGSGRVDEVPAPGGGKGLKVALWLRAEHLAFDDQLRRALPGDWRATWGLLNPSGMSTVDATIRAEPGRPDHHRIELVPEPGARVNLVLEPAPGTGFAARRLEFPPFEDVTGRFVFDDGTVTMAGNGPDNPVGFRFRGSPVRARSGTVRLEPGGRFRLGVEELYVTVFRVDADLRRLMPPVMSQFAQKLDEARTFTIRTNLGLGWSGKAGDPATCWWDKGLIIFNGNTIRAGLDLGHIQGQLDHVRGRFDGRDLEVHGAIDIESIDLMGQQVTRFRSPLDVAKGVARLGDFSGRLLGGRVFGNVAVAIDSSPRFSAEVAVAGADLERFTRTMPGRQRLRGLVSGKLAVSGRGGDTHSLQGEGEAKIARGDLGELPPVLRLVKILNLSPATRTAFDSADVAFSIRDGRTTLDPIQLTGDAFSLRGAGTLDPQGDLDLDLRVLYGRDAYHIRGLSDLTRELSGKIFDVRVTGPAAAPKYSTQVLPPFSAAFRRPPADARRPAAARGRDIDRTYSDASRF
ncbi:MAG TPA: AsmA-like C-terminal region-containing protein [Isosphaeraceae bacterium]|nr:AsmA-like C-terminal region-containing protein [Isosphaeraceae bacterium]